MNIRDGETSKPNKRHYLLFYIINKSDRLNNKSTEHFAFLNKRPFITFAAFMQDIEPFYNWRHLYIAEEDELSPFYGVEHSEFEYSNTVYNYYIHPQWDEFGSRTLYMKVLFVDYELNFAIIEMIGEWNDAVENDIMQLKRSVIDLMVTKGIYKFILITENVLNFHSSDTDYYEEWHEDVKDDGGWVVAINMPEQTQYDFHKSHIDWYVKIMESPNWRTFQPGDFFQSIDNKMLYLS